MSEFYNRVIKPVSIPIYAALFIFVLVFSFSRVLLAVPEIGSTSLAMLLAAEILGVASVLAAARRVNAAQKMISVVLGLALVAGGGVAAAIGEREIGHGGEGEGPHITAEGLVFLEQTVEVPADEAFQLTFENRDAGVPHNVAVYEDDTAEASLFVGEIFNGVATQVYEVPALSAGEHFFRCDVHPDMTGTMVAGEGGGHGEPTHEPTTEPTGSASPSATPTGGGPSTEIEITAQGIAFDTEAFTLAADSATTIVFHNNDPSIPHNVAIYPDDSADGALFDGEDVTGVETVEYEVPRIPAGEYYFQCDIHPNMNGTATFA